MNKLPGKINGKNFWISFFRCITLNLTLYKQHGVVPFIADTLWHNSTNRQNPWKTLVFLIQWFRFRRLKFFVKWSFLAALSSSWSLVVHWSVGRSVRLSTFVKKWPLEYQVSEWVSEWVSKWGSEWGNVTKFCN